MTGANARRGGRRASGRAAVVAAVVPFAALLPATPASAAEGSVLTFGADSFGQLGNGASGATYVPTAVLAGASDVAGGREHALALVGTTVYAWGSDAKGAVGDGGSYVNAQSPKPVLTGAAAVSTGHYHSVALRADGSVSAWGWNNRGQTGPAGGSALKTPAPVIVALPGPAVQVAAGRAHSLALLADGSVYAWGDNAGAQLGLGTADTSRHSAPMRVTGLPPIAFVAGGRDSSFAVAQTGELWGWGSSQYGQVGDGTVGTSGGAPRLVRTPVVVLSGVRMVESGADHTVAARTDGTVWTWGRNRYGQLGAAGGTRSRPAQVAGLAGVAHVTAGRDHNLALTSGGQAYAWGRNDGGQLGASSTSLPQSTTPRLVPGLTGAVDAGGGQQYTVVLGTAG